MLQLPKEDFLMTTSLDAVAQEDTPWHPKGSNLSPAAIIYCPPLLLLSCSTESSVTNHAKALLNKCESQKRNLYSYTTRYYFLQQPSVTLEAPSFDAHYMRTQWALTSNDVVFEVEHVEHKKNGAVLPRSTFTSFTIAPSRLDTEL